MSWKGAINSLNPISTSYRFFVSRQVGSDSDGANVYNTRHGWTEVNWRHVKMPIMKI